ncbi:MAG: ParB/RepB/Spo0J family partition protein [Ruminococcus sp.]|nr:ParB/RepB/Spo0J family partition protein [Ruminococcus sp.]
MSIGGLGSGLDTLFDENTEDMQVKKMMRTTDIEPNRDQPRREFSEEKIAELADSIQQYGMLQPIVVRPYGLTYQIVAGERRWRAARLLQMEEIPVIIREFSDEEVMAVALIENLQRENLNPLEEARGYAQLMDQFHLTQEEVAKRVGKSRSTVANALRILKLPPSILEMVKDDDLSAGQARALLSIDDPFLQMEAAGKAAEGKLTVRAIEKIDADEKKKKSSAGTHRDSFYDEIEISLENYFGRRVKVNSSGSKGTLSLEFYDIDDLASLAQQIAPDGGKRFT